MTLLEALKEVQRRAIMHREGVHTKGAFSCASGICYHLRRVSAGLYDSATIRPMFKQWPGYSGDPVYPVPSPGRGSAMRAYETTRDVWVGEYGADRMELLAFLIATAAAEGR